MAKVKIKAKKPFDPESYVGSTLSESLLNIIKAVDEEYGKPIDPDCIVPIAITISDTTGEVLFKETASTKRKIVNIRERENVSKFNSEVESILLKHKSTIELAHVNIVSVSTPKVLKIRNKDEKYIKLDITVDGYPTLIEAIKQLSNLGLRLNFRVYITYTETHKTEVVGFDVSYTNRETFYTMLNENIANARLTWAPKYADCSEFKIRI